MYNPREEEEEKDWKAEYLKEVDKNKIAMQQMKDSVLKVARAIQDRKKLVDEDYYKPYMELANTNQSLTGFATLLYSLLEKI